MDEDILQKYLNSIQIILNCPDGQEINLLEDNSSLYDENILTFIKMIIPQIDELYSSKLLTFSELILERLDKWNLLNQEVIQLHHKGYYQQAINVAQENLKQSIELLGENHPKIAISLNNLAEIYRHQGVYPEAETLYFKALKLWVNLLGNEHPNVASGLNNLAGLYCDQGRYLEAEKKYLEALMMRKNLLGDEHSLVIESLNNLASLYYLQGFYSKAESSLIEALTIIDKKSIDENIIVFATIMHNLAGIYESQGRYSEAEQKYLTSLLVKKKILGDEHPDIADTLDNLSVLFFKKGYYSKAEEKSLEALEIRKIFFGNNHPAIATSLNNLAALSRSKGDYAKAEQIYLESLLMRKKLLGDEHPDISINLNNLAELYIDQGRYSEAEQKHLESLELKKLILGDSHPELATTLNNLGAFYKSQGRYSEAEKKYSESINILKKSLGSEHPNLASCLANLAGLYEARGQILEAEQKYFESLEMKRELLGESHRDLASNLNNLALLFHEQGRYSEAEQKYFESLSILEINLGLQHPDVASCLVNIGGFLSATNRHAEGLYKMGEANKIDDKIISDVFSFSSETDRISYLTTLRYKFELFISLVYKKLSDSAQALQSALDLILKRKALSASALTAQNEALYSDRYPHLTEDFHKLRDLSEQIIYLTFSTPQIQDFTTYQQQLAQLQTEHNNLQKNLASQVPEIQLQKQLPNCSDVASELPTGSTLIEFVRFDVFNFKAIPAKGQSQWQPSRYLAFILPAGQPESVEIIDIGEAEYIDRLIREFQELVSGTGKNPESQLGMFSKRPPTLIFRKYHPQAGIKLRQVIFDKLRPTLKENQHLIIAPDGELNLVPFQILPSDETGEKMLMDEFTISYLTVGRDILRQKIDTKRPESVNTLVFASPNFNFNAEIMTPDAIHRQNAQTDNLRESIANNPLKPAVGTSVLGERVAQKLKVAPYMENEALESYFQPLQCPRILLIATHGVFLPNQPKEDSPSFPSQRETALLPGDRFFGRVENPMLRSALALAGANTWAKGDKLPPEAGKGVLFAQDVAGLDLWANEITVLSACETAVGDVAIGEGVFGLRRAFAVAGAKTLIMSLWSVNGWTTALLMERFFDNCEAGLGRAAALQSAQNYVRNITVRELQQLELGQEILKQEFNNGRELDTAILVRQAENKPLAHPYYWGAWICQGETKAVEIFKNSN